MMTLLHSVWSGGESAAGRRRSLLAMGALLALLASVLVWAAPRAQAQSNQAPTAIALPVSVNPASGETGHNSALGVGNLVLDGSLSFDPDDGDTTATCAGCTYKWEILTSTYVWLGGDADGVTDYDSSSPISASNLPPLQQVITSVPKPADSLIPAYGSVIEFQLTVTDAKGASDTTTVTYNLKAPQGPTADIAVTATFEDKASSETGAKKWTVDAVVDGPGENGNADNEWDIKENSLLVLDASGSTDPDNQALTYLWELVYQSGDAGGIEKPRQAAAEARSTALETDANDTAKKFSTDDTTTTDAVETVGRLNVGERNQSLYYAIYNLTVTDTDGKKGTASVRIVIHDQPADPTVKITIQGDTPGTPAVENGATGCTAVDSSKCKVNGIAPPDANKFAVNEEDAATGADTALTLVATTYDADNDLSGDGTIDGSETAPGVVWDPGDFEAIPSTTATQAVTVKKTAAVGDTFSASASVKQSDVSASITFEIVKKSNQRPVATILTPTHDDDNSPLTPPIAGASATEELKPDANGVYKLTGFGFDGDGGSTISNWTQLGADNKPVKADSDLYVPLTGAFSNAVSFNTPENKKITDVTLAFTVIDDESTYDTKLVKVKIDRTPAAATPAANAGADQVVAPESTVILSGSSAGITFADNDAAGNYTWSISKVSTVPDTTALSTKDSAKVHEELNTLLEAWNGADLNNTGGTSNPAGDGTTKTIGDVLETISPPADNATGNGPYQYFTAPKLPASLNYVQVTFTLAVDGATVDKEDTVTITVADDFFSGYIPSPDFCTARSLGGAKTYAFDSDGDGVADACSLTKTRRSTVARQNALLELVRLGSTLDRTDTDFRKSSADFEDLVIGRDGTGDAGSSDNISSGTGIVSTVVGTCTQAKAIDLGEGDDIVDACSKDGKLTAAPSGVDAVDAAVFYSGAIDGPGFCTNLSFGGIVTYPMDSDDDGVADVCSYAFTKREAVARQMALDMFEAHALYASVLKVECANLGSTDFGDAAADLANYMKDDCTPAPAGATVPGKGSALPAPTT